MSSLQKILVVVDRRLRRSPAVDRALGLARKSGAQLHLCLFDHDALIEKTADRVSPEVMHLAKAQYLQQRRDWLISLAASLADSGVPVECVVVWSPVIDEAILDKILDVEPDL
ncbi:MAG TPA: universal stress protein, partial [Nevskiaceae bacterium]|nr:universal stress protein [Nevskiaceae bacterium]